MHSRGGSNCSPLRLRAPPRLPGAYSSTLVDSEHPMSFTLISGSSLPQRTLLRVITFIAGRTFLRHSVLERRERSRRACQSRSHAASSCHAFDARVYDKWSYEQLPMVQRIMNTVEKTSTGVTPVELILNNSIQLSNRILAPGSTNPTSQIALSDTMDNWVARQHTLLQVAQAHQHQSDSHLLVEYDPSIT